jgi:hypothetical protein
MTVAPKPRKDTSIPKANWRKRVAHLGGEWAILDAEEEAVMLSIRNSYFASVGLKYVGPHYVRQSSLVEGGEERSQVRGLELRQLQIEKRKKEISAEINDVVQNGRSWRQVFL